METNAHGNASSMSGNGESTLHKASSSVHAAVNSVAGAVDEVASKASPAINRVAAMAHQAVDKAAGSAAPAADWLTEKKPEFECRAEETGRRHVQLRCGQSAEGSGNCCGGGLSFEPHHSLKKRA